MHNRSNRGNIVKVIIQVPSYNEEKTLGLTLWSLPRRLPNVDTVDWLVVDDGSEDCTSQVATQFGAHVVRLPKHSGLATAFKVGLEACLALGADIIVNTDADNQYQARDITKLIAPILNEEAEFVIGTRPIMETPHFSYLKKLLQLVGSSIVRLFSGTQIPDARSGFRAISRRAAAQLKVYSRYTYTLETIIQAGHENIAIQCVPIRTNRDLRPSRLIRSIPNDVFKSAVTIVRTYARYSPFSFFAWLSAVALCPGFFSACYWMVHNEQGMNPFNAMAVATVFSSLGASFILLLAAFVTDLIAPPKKVPNGFNVVARTETSYAFFKSQSHPRRPQSSSINSRHG